VGSSKPTTLAHRWSTSGLLPTCFSFSESRAAMLPRSTPLTSSATVPPSASSRSQSACPPRCIRRMMRHARCRWARTSATVSAPSSVIRWWSCWSILLMSARGHLREPLLRTCSRSRETRTPGLWAFLSSASAANSTMLTAWAAPSFVCMSRSCARSMSTLGILSECEGTKQGSPTPQSRTNASPPAPAADRPPGRESPARARRSGSSTAIRIARQPSPRTHRHLHC
jgi:hypothetical protein